MKWCSFYFVIPNNLTSNILFCPRIIRYHFIICHVPWLSTLALLLWLYYHVFYSLIKVCTHLVHKGKYYFAINVTSDIPFHLTIVLLFVIHDDKFLTLWNIIHCAIDITCNSFFLQTLNAVFPLILFEYTILKWSWNGTLN